jgi:surface protein
MSRSKYINTFNTTADYENYIESAVPEFPNVGYDKEAGEVKIKRTSPNDHLFYGELADATQNIPILSLKTGGSVLKTYTPTVDTLTNEFYIDDWGTVPTFNLLGTNFLTNKSNIKSIKKFKGLNTSSVTDMSNMLNGCTSLTSVDLSGLNTSNVTNMASIFNGCSSLTSLDLSNWDVSNVTNMSSIFNGCSSLTSLDLSNWDVSNLTNMYNMFYSCNNMKDVYITIETTLMKLTNNLTSKALNYIPSTATIHYNDIDYKWQNNAWTPQS